jgi:hypothetical protein
MTPRLIAEQSAAMDSHEDGVDGEGSEGVLMSIEAFRQLLRTSSDHSFQALGVVPGRKWQLEVGAARLRAAQ